MFWILRYGVCKTLNNIKFIDITIVVMVISMLFERFCNEKDIKKATIKGYKTSLSKYSKYFDLTLEEFIEEAISEEDEKTPMRRRSIKARFLQFRTHLLTETKLEVSTIKTHMNRINAFYKHYEIETPDLPKLKENKIELTYLDLPNKKHIKKSCKEHRD